VAQNLSLTLFDIQAEKLAFNEASIKESIFRQEKNDGIRVHVFLLDESIST
jgi:hypothetical protein